MDLNNLENFAWIWEQSWKFYLNLRTILKILLEFELTRSHVISLIPSWLSQWKTLLGEGLINFRILLLKTTKLPKGSKFLHSMIVGEKKEFLKKLCLMLKKGMLPTFLVAYAWFFSVISLKRYWEIVLLQMLWNIAKFL